MKTLWAIAGLTMIGSFSVQAQTPDPRATDAAQFFGAFCVSTGGTSARALAVLANGNALATRLPADFVQQAQGGREGGVGWMIRSPKNAELMLDYDTRGVCSLRLKEGDEQSVRDAFEALIKGAASSVGAELISQEAEEGETNNVRTTYRAHSLTLSGRTAHIALTTAEQPIGFQQHYMTFSSAE